MSSLSACKLGKLTIRGVSSITGITGCDGTAIPFAGGDGSIGNPYEVCSLDQFKRLGSPLYNTSNFILVNDIDYSGEQADAISGFDGVLDGDDYAIKNFTSDPVTPTGGLFDATSGTIKKLVLDNFNVTSNSYRFGALVGNFTGTAEDITLSNAVVYSDLGESEVGGLFGIVTGAALTRLTLTNVSVSSDGHNPHPGDPDACIQLAGAGCVGGIAGAAVSSNLNNCYVNGTSEVSGFRPNTGYVGGAIGGLIGSAYNTNVLSSNSNATIYGDAFIGGLIGSFQSTPSALNVQNSYSTGNVNYYYSSLMGYTAVDYDGGGVDTGHVGGLVGFIRSGEVQTSYASGNVMLVTSGYLTSINSTLPAPETTNKIGGLVGKIDNNNLVLGGGTINASYAGGDVEGLDDVGGLIGVAIESNISNSYTQNTTSVTGVNNVGAFVGNSLDSNYTANTSAGSALGTGDYIGGFGGYVFGNMGTNCTFDNTTSSATASGNRYVGGMFGIARFIDITTATSTGAASGAGATQQYIGGFVGLLRTANIDLVTVSGNATGSRYVGGFGATVMSAVITNSTASGNVTQTGLNDTAGGFAAILSATTVSDCSSTGAVTGYNTVGGFVASLSLGNTITDCSSTGTVTGNNTVGGFAGSSPNASYTRCSHTTGTVTGVGQVGGLIGIATNGTIDQSFATSAVVGSFETAGLVGRTAMSPDISNSYSTSTITGGAGGSIGGLVGDSSSSLTTITDSYYNGTITSSGNYTGGLVGIGLVSIEDSYSRGTISSSSWYAGGLVGSMLSSSIVDYSFSRMDVATTGGNAGGIAAFMEPSSLIRRSFSTGNIKAIYNVGGIAGTMGLTTTVDNVFSTGTIESTDLAVAHVGGLVGNMSGTSVNIGYSISTILSAGGSDAHPLLGFFWTMGGATASDLHFYDYAGAFPDNSTSVAIATGALEIQANYTGLSFPASWRMTTVTPWGINTPVLSWICTSPLPTGITCL